MSITKQLYQLQELDLELESSQQTLNRITSQLGESAAVIEIQNRLTSECQNLDELTHQQQSVEWEIDDTSVKLASFEEELYSGRIRNPKELTNLQQEIDILKTKRSKLEDRVLEIMEQVEMATKNVSNLESELKALETEWQNQQKQLTIDLEKIKTVIANLQHKRQLLETEIDPQISKTYDELKRQRGTAVAKVEQGICCGCRISLPVTELRQVRSGSLVRCSTCGRILFLA